MFRPRSTLQLVILLLLVFLLKNSLSWAQNGEPDSNPVVTQGSSNLGNVQPFALTDVMVSTGIQQSRATLTGNGRRIGVLDTDFGSLTDLQNRLGLLPQIFPGHELADYDGGQISHGTDVLEIIYTIAPEADYYVCRYRTFDDFITCIDWMIVSNVHIINHSAGVPALPLDGSSQWSLEVERAARENILWINAAGNFAGGFIRDFFTDTNENGYHEFRAAGIVEELSIDAINQPLGRVLLSWTQTATRSAADINLDLEIRDRTGTVIAESKAVQQGQFDDVPLEMVIVDMTAPFSVHIIGASAGVSQVSFGLFIEFADLPISEQGGSVIAPGDSPFALTVGALQGGSLAPYSSRGPNELGGLKPDITAPGEVQLGDGRTFVGTSAAAPVVAGAAALLWQAAPEKTRVEIYEAMRSAIQDDTENPGPDNFYGMGRLYLSRISRGNGTIEPTSVPIIQNFETPSPLFDPNLTCPGSPPSRLQVNGYGRLTDGDSPQPLNFRSQPNISSTRVGQIPTNAVFEVIAGPTCSQNYAWFQVRFGRQMGWIAEGDMEDYYTEPVVSSERGHLGLTNCPHGIFVPGGNGCAQQPSSMIWSAFQPFEYGFMLWREYPDDFWALFNDGSFLYFNRSMVTDLSDNANLAAPDSLHAPISGFGRIWGHSPYIQNKIGWGAEPERGYDSQMQSAQIELNGNVIDMVFFSHPDGRVIEIVLDGSTGWSFAD